MQRKQEEEKEKLSKQLAELEELKNTLASFQVNQKQLPKETLFTRVLPTMGSKNFVDVRNLQDCSPFLKLDEAPIVRNRS